MLERERSDRAINRDRDSEQSPGRSADPFRYFPQMEEPLPWRDFERDTRDSNHHQQRSSFSSFSSSSSGAEPTPPVVTISSAVRMPSTHAHPHLHPHPRHTIPNSFHTLDQRRRDIRALGPRPISRDGVASTGWGSESPRIDLRDRPRVDLYTRPRPAPRVGAGAEGLRSDSRVDRPYLNVNTTAEPVSRSTGRAPQAWLFHRWNNTGANTSTNTSTSPSTSRVPELPWQIRPVMPNRQGSTSTRTNTVPNMSLSRLQFASPRPFEDWHSRSPSSPIPIDHTMDIDDVFPLRRERESFSSNSASADQNDSWVAVPATSSSGSSSGTHTNNNNRLHSQIEVGSEIYTRLMNRMRQDNPDSDAVVAPTPVEEEPRPSSEFPEDFFILPAVPSPGLGGIFDHSSNQNSSDPVNEAEQNRRRSSAPSPPLMYRSARGSFIFPQRRRSPSPTREEQANRMPPSLRSRSPPLGSVRGPARFNPQSFTPGPFRNTMQRMFEMNRRHENPENRPSSLHNNAPSIPPLSFEGNFSPARTGPPSSRQEENTTSPQVIPILLAGSL